MMRSQLVGPALAYLRARGGDADALIRKFSLPATAERDREVLLPLADLRALLDDAAQAANDPFLGAHVAEGLPRGAYGIMEYSCRSAPTVREALVRVTRYMALLNELVEVSFAEDETRGSVEQRIAGEPLCVGRHANEFFVVYLLVQCRQLTGSPFVPDRAWFAHPAPRDVGELQRLVGIARLEFGRERNGIAIPRPVLDLPLQTADAPLLTILDAQATAALEERRAPSRFLGQVRQMVRERLSDGPPSLEATARAMKMSARTLQRRLGEEDTNYNALVDGVRADLAELYVRDPARPLGEVAYLLGYSELSAFLRAFKRWTGKSPSDFRR